MIEDYFLGKNKKE
ncbi:BnaA09g41500D [Brassica napus]|uniref:BnaA09g41500D protein n=1 Tax=Brassica napus TaxID=3708 RepID=A0A078HD88_BRANA|nr:BnaA09g41500D [Brassica napus]